MLIRLAGAEPIAARVGPVLERLDVALLKLVDDLPAEWDAVPVAGRSGDLDGAPFVARGYPMARPYATDRLAIDGNVVDANATYAERYRGSSCIPGRWVKASSRAG